MKSYERIFGSGPLGLALSLALLVVASWVRPLLPGPSSLLPYPVRIVVLLLAGGLSLGLASWSFRCLPPEARGRELCRSGPFRYVRHPLYATFLSIFDFGLAVFLDHWIYLAWAFLLHPLWHHLMRSEEALMAREFGQDYLEYAKRTGRFLPRLSIFSRSRGDLEPTE